MITWTQYIRQLRHAEEWVQRRAAEIIKEALADPRTVSVTEIHDEIIIERRED